VSTNGWRAFEDELIKDESDLLALQRPELSLTDR
jgi:hypothetical protein